MDFNIYYLVVAVMTGLLTIVAFGKIENKNKTIKSLRTKLAETNSACELQEDVIARFQTLYTTYYGPVSKEELLERIGLTSRQLDKHFNVFKAMGLIKTIGRGRGTKYKIRNDIKEIYNLK
jgi:DNA-binding transcriptional ArsR family regulator